MIFPALLLCGLIFLRLLGLRSGARSGCCGGTGRNGRRGDTVVIVIAIGTSVLFGHTHATRPANLVLTVIVLCGTDNGDKCRAEGDGEDQKYRLEMMDHTWNGKGR